MLIETLSTFPGMYDSVMGASMMRIAQEKGILDFRAHDLRDWTHDRHRTTDDASYGGGAGLVMKCEPIFEAYCDIACGRIVRGRGVDGFSEESELSKAESCETGECLETKSCAAGECLSAKSCEAGECLASTDVVAQVAKPYTIFLAPFGKPFSDDMACELCKKERLLFICGHYEGIDERAYSLADEVISLGDYVLTSGELASMVVIDAVVRKLPGVLGAEGGAVEESFCNGLLEYPQYTRPSVFRNPVTGEDMSVPDTLLSGNHAAIDEWRREQSYAKTAKCRPDLLRDYDGDSTRNFNVL